MTPSGAGRHCASCRKEVVDFSSMTDAGLALYLKQFPDFGCGRFRADQIGRPIQAPIIPERTVGDLIARIAASTVLFLSLGLPSIAQHHTGRNARIGKTRIQTPAKTIPVPQPDVSCIRLKGVVLNATGAPVADADMALYWQNQVIAQARTDSAGRFEITSDLDLAGNTRVLLAIRSGNQYVRSWYRIGSQVTDYIFHLPVPRPAGPLELSGSPHVEYILGGAFGNNALDNEITRLITLDNQDKGRKGLFKKLFRK